MPSKAVAGLGDRRIRRFSSRSRAADQMADAPTDLNDATKRTSQRACSDGVKCVAGLRVDCRIGSYCVGGKEFLCPPGVVGEGVTPFSRLFWDMLNVMLTGETLEVEVTAAK